MDMLDVLCIHSQGTHYYLVIYCQMEKAKGSLAVNFMYMLDRTLYALQTHITFNCQKGKK
jgi:hypothetical protein